MKYTKEFKLECVMKYKNNDRINDPPGVSHEAFRAQILKWNKIYDSLGEAGFEHGRPTLDIDQRLELIRLVESGESYRSVAFSAGIGSDLLIKWHNIYLKKGIDGLKSLKRGRKPMPKKTVNIDTSKQDKDKTKEELIEELKIARIENEYLKKLNALVQKREAQKQKKK